jgi:hypothetical protein
MNHILQNPFNFAGAEPSPAEAAATSHAHIPTEGVAAMPIEWFDESPLRDEPLPLFLTEPHPDLDRELTALLAVHFGVAA